jgi:hypothetical protein
LPELGPYSFATLVYLVFTFVTWELRGEYRGRPSLPWVSGILTIGATLRLFAAIALEGSEGVLTDVDTVLAGGFLVVVLSTVATVLEMAATSDPTD